MRTIVFLLIVLSVCTVHAAEIQDERYKLVHNNELYDLVNDLNEKTDVADKHPEVVKQLRSVYDTFWADARPYMVNEEAPAERQVVRPYWELYEKHIGPIPPRRRKGQAQ